MTALLELEGRDQECTGEDGRKGTAGSGMGKARQSRTQPGVETSPRKLDTRCSASERQDPGVRGRAPVPRRVRVTFSTAAWSDCRGQWDQGHNIGGGICCPCCITNIPTHCD